MAPTSATSNRTGMLKIELSGSHISAANASSGVAIIREFVNNTAITGNLSFPIPCDNRCLKAYFTITMEKLDKIKKKKQIQAVFKEHKTHRFV